MVNFGCKIGDGGYEVLEIREVDPKIIGKFGYVV
jgi:hypothetical protein